MMWFTDTIGGTITAQIVPVLEDSVWIEGSCYVLCGNLIILDLCPKEFSIDVDVIFNIETLPPIGICPGECVDFCGELYCTEGTYSCWDSCTLQIQPVYFLPPQITYYGIVEICQGDCFFWNGQFLCDPGTYDWYGLTYNGCDSLEYIEIQVLPSQTIDLGTISLCEGDCFDWNGQLFCDPGFSPGPNRDLMDVWMNTFL
ncbi:MAG: hypothetical protein IPJ40_01740 [Saprospirales bacterium]|nr:hypothetical protein [Saprospirales bacterium]